MTRGTHTNRYRTAFTLIELLVVIAIIAVLASLLVPTLSRAKAAARRAHCTSNLHQVEIAFSIYVSDHGLYPNNDLALRNIVLGDTESRLELAEPNSAGPDGKISQAWVDWSFAWEDAHRPFMCPGLGGWNWYGWNSYGSGGAQRLAAKLPVLGLGIWLQEARPATIMSLIGPRRESEVVTPSDMIAFGDIEWPPVEMITTGWGSPQEQVSLSGTFSPQFIFEYHQTGANGAFCDGHVEFGSRPRFDTKQDNVRRRWNTDNEPHSEYWK
jgi:prepilin-type N-terminal cleavage/methylation domain-containing protein/prepilin-type processing-associated H-X9-DG protein